MSIKIRSKIEKKLLTYFFLNEERRSYTNELARTIGEDPKNVHRILLRLLETDILKSEYQGKERYFFANTASPLYSEYKKIFQKTYGVEQELTKILKKIPGIKEAYIYGSYAKNRMGAFSDIDILTVGDANTIDINREIIKLQKTTDREINLTNISESEFQIKLNQKDPFITEIWNSEKIKII
ncbi:MAG: nucleotidyltransferase domain-containing protein [Elusimicrobia bacterium]|nr:nucleotidyltransferase domain-containing protein [Elusimicrobiota bacterium]